MEEEELTFEEYVKEYYPEVAKEYERYFNRRDVPKVGDLVRSLQVGFGSLFPGKILKVLAVDENGLTLNNEKSLYCVELEYWYKILEIKQRKNNGR